MAQFQFRAAAGEIVTRWSQAGEKRYSGLALIRENAAGVTASMLRVSDKATPAEYRSLAQAAIELAKLAEQAADVAEKALKDAVKMSAGQRERIREGLKNLEPKARVAAALTLTLTFPDFKLEDFGYASETGKSIPEKAPTPPKAAEGADAAILAAVGK